jgi:hypothetical protein
MKLLIGKLECSFSDGSIRRPEVFRHHVVSQKHCYLELRAVVAAAIKSEVNESAGRSFDLRVTTVWPAILELPKRWTQTGLAVGLFRPGIEQSKAFGRKTRCGLFEVEYEA